MEEAIVCADVTGYCNRNQIQKLLLLSSEEVTETAWIDTLVKKLKEAGVGKIYLYVTHCENTVYDGELLKNNGLIEKIYTTDTILTNLESPKIELVERFR